MVDLLIIFAIAAVGILIMIGFTMLVISDVQHLSSLFENKTVWIIAIIISLGLIIYSPPNFENDVNLYDLQVASGVLKSQTIFTKRKDSDNYISGNTYITLSDSDEATWDFTHCDTNIKVSFKCKDKPITVWHKNRVVYQVEMDDKIIYSIENSNRKILISNMGNLMWYIFLKCYLPILLVAISPHVRALNEMKMRKEFEETLTNETLDEDHSGKILRRFCKNCGAELGTIVEDRSAEDTLMKIEYEQYKFCANCGLESDPTMPIADKQSDKVGMWFIFFIIAALMFALFMLIAVFITLNIQGLLISIAMFATIFKAIKLINMSNCPSCGREYKEEHFCPNCGTNLNEH